LKTSFLLFLVLLLTTSSAYKEKPPCHCLDYYKNKLTNSGPVLEFQAAASGIDFHKVTNGLFMDSVFLKNHLSASDYENLEDFFTVNVSDEIHFLESPRIGFANAKDTSLINELLKNYQEQKLELEDGFRLLWSQKPTRIDEKLLYTLYAVRRPEESEVILRSENIENARISNFPTDTTWSVSINFDEEGSEKMSALSIQNVGNYLLLISHNKVLSAPIIISPIDHGYILIDGKFTEEEATSKSNWISCDGYSRRIGQKKFKKGMKKCQ